MNEVNIKLKRRLDYQVRRCEEKEKEREGTNIQEHIRSEYVCLYG